MSDDAPSGTQTTDKARQQAEEKQKRLADALRANLHRRKAQSRARAQTSDQGGIPDEKAADESAERSSS